jgi:hypothetical protein
MWAAIAKRPTNGHQLLPETATPLPRVSEIAGASLRRQTPMV